MSVETAMVSLLGSNGQYTSKEYAFFVSSEMKLCVGDIVTCETVNGPVFGRFVAYDQSCNYKANKWVISNYTEDMKNCAERVKAEKLAKLRADYDKIKREIELLEGTGEKPVLIWGKNSDYKKDTNEYRRTSGGDGWVF